MDRTLVTRVYQEELAMVHPMIAALRSGREATILQYADLDVPRESIRAQTAVQEVPYVSTDRKTLQDAEIPKQDQLISLLIQMGIGEDIAPVVAEQAIAERPDENLFGLVAHVQNLGKRHRPNRSWKQKRGKRKMNPTYV